MWSALHHASPSMDSSNPREGNVHPRALSLLPEHIAGFPVFWITVLVASQTRGLHADAVPRCASPAATQHWWTTPHRPRTLNRYSVKPNAWSPECLADNHNKTFQLSGSVPFSNGCIQSEDARSPARHPCPLPLFGLACEQIEDSPNAKHLLKAPGGVMLEIRNYNCKCHVTTGKSAIWEGRSRS
jgi:hypothetical protein